MSDKAIDIALGLIAWVLLTWAAVAWHATISAGL